METLISNSTPPPLAAEDAAPPAPPQSLELHPPFSLSSPPRFIDSFAQLKTLSSAIDAFNHCYQDLHDHLHSIKTALLLRLPDDVTLTTQPLSCAHLAKPRQVGDEEEKTSLSELEGLCKMMCSRDIKRYVVSNLSDLPKLREQVPKALKLAPNPPKLVLDCLGRFFLQGSKAYAKNSPMIPAREASVLVLECFLLMMGMDDNHDGPLVIDKAVKEEAETVALAWRKRLVSEGGVAKASEIDARGLLFFVSCFGILNRFKREDISDLVLASNAKEILGVLHKSTELMNKIPEIVEWMIKNKMELDAVDLIYTFGLVERFNPQTILTSCLRESKVTGRKKKAALGSAATMFEANTKQLATLRSILKCLERHDIDPSELLPGWQISENISTLEKDIANFDGKQGDNTGNKRKSTETEASKKTRIQEAKRSRHNSHILPQRISGLVDSRRNLPNNGLPSHVYNYAAPPSVVYGGPGAGLMPENMLPPAVGADILAASRGGMLSTGSYTGGVHGGIVVESTGQVINHGGQPHSWHADAALIDKYAGQSSSSSLGLTHLYRASISGQGFPGAPNATTSGPAVRSSTSDLYQFADSVVENDPYMGNISHGPGPMTNVIPASVHRSSYLY